MSTSSDHSSQLQMQAGEGDVPVYASAAEALEKVQERWKSRRQPYPAMYSTVLGGIVLDPAMMAIPIDDHMVHRGHGVFDTAMLLMGRLWKKGLIASDSIALPSVTGFVYLYELDQHLDRFLRSAAKAKIGTPFPRETLKSILIQMTAASNCKKGSLRYWLSAGPGDFLLSSKGCTGPAFYAVVIADDYSQCRHGVKAVTSTVPMKPPLFATAKNVNYLPNVLSVIEAEECGAFSSVWVDEQGHVAEGPNMNVAFITGDKELVLPAFDKILSGCTAKRLLALAPRLVQDGLLKSVSTATVTVEEAKRAAEMAYVGSSLPLLPIVEWDSEHIGDGKVGKLTLALSDLLWEDMKSGPDRIPVPYK